MLLVTPDTAHPVALLALVQPHAVQIAVSVIVAPFSVVTLFKLPPAATVDTLGVHAVVPSDFLHVTVQPPNTLFVFNKSPWTLAVHVPA